VTAPTDERPPETPPPEIEWATIEPPPSFGNRSEPADDDAGERGRPLGQWVLAGGSGAALGGVGLFNLFGPIGLAAGAIVAAGGAVAYGVYRVRRGQRPGFKTPRMRTRRERALTKSGLVGNGKRGKGLLGGKGPRLGKGGGPKLGGKSGRLLGGKGPKLGGKSGKLLGGGRGAKLGGKAGLGGLGKGRRSSSRLGSIGAGGRGRSGSLLGRGGKAGLGLGRRGGKLLGGKGKAGFGRWGNGTGKTAPEKAPESSVADSAKPLELLAVVLVVPRSVPPPAGKPPAGSWPRKLRWRAAAVPGCGSVPRSVPPGRRGGPRRTRSPRGPRTSQLRSPR
jgi:hypothetical protein